MSTDAVLSRLLRAVPARVLPLLALALVLLAVAVAFLLPGGGDPAPGAAPASSPPASAAPAGSGALDLLPTPVSDLPTVTVAQLPPEARQTLALIEDGGPYPYDRDGLTFGNRERLLPPEGRGFYAEYTVITPGGDDRGARRIVAGSDGGRFYTDDHYDSFREVVP